MYYTFNPRDRTLHIIIDNIIYALPPPYPSTEAIQPTHADSRLDIITRLY